MSFRWKSIHVSHRRRHPADLDMAYPSNTLDGPDRRPGAEVIDNAVKARKK
jgi:hypothetical protein